jgi:hypothetical protein
MAKASGAVSADVLGEVGQGRIPGTQKTRPHGGKLYAGYREFRSCPGVPRPRREPIRPKPCYRTYDASPAAKTALAVGHPAVHFHIRRTVRAGSSGRRFF